MPPMLRNLWRIIVPSLALEHGCIRREILALSALHLAQHQLDWDALAFNTSLASTGRIGIDEDATVSSNIGARDLKHRILAELIEVKARYIIRQKEQMMNPSSHEG